MKRIITIIIVFVVLGVLGSGVWSYEDGGITIKEGMVKLVAIPPGAYCANPPFCGETKQILMIYFQEDPDSQLPFMADIKKIRGYEDLRFSLRRAEGKFIRIKKNHWGRFLVSFS